MGFMGFSRLSWGPLKLNSRLSCNIHFMSLHQPHVAVAYSKFTSKINSITLSVSPRTTDLGGKVVWEPRIMAEVHESI